MNINLPIAKEAQQQQNHGKPNEKLARNAARPQLRRYDSDTSEPTSRCRTARKARIPLSSAPKMWHSATAANENSRMRERVTEDDRRQRSRQRNGKIHDDSNGDSATGNVDSGFLSSGNIQFSSEICESVVSGREDDSQQEIATPIVVTTAITTIAPEPMRTVDSGVDLDLSESLNQLSLKQVSLNPLGAKGGRIQAEPTDLKLSPVSAQPTADEADESRGRNSDGVDEWRATIHEEPWQLYYAQDSDGDTQLHIAIVQGFVEAALSLIRIAPDPCLLNILNDDWQSPLHLAVLTHQPMIVRRLILAGADPSLRDFRGNTALHLTCANGDVACAKALTDPLSPIERNELTPDRKVPALPQNLEQRNYNGEMCLHVAAASGRVDMVHLLLRLGADLEAREALAGRTALYLAMEHGCRSVIAFLLQECKPCLNTQTYAGTTAYQLALCMDNHLARELVRLGAKPEPLPESDSESSEDEDAVSSSPSNYMPVIVQMQNAVVVKV